MNQVNELFPLINEVSEKLIGIEDYFMENLNLIAENEDLFNDKYVYDESDDDEGDDEIYDSNAIYEYEN